MSMQYDLKFSRYDKKRAERRDSRLVFIHAESFTAACKIAHDMVYGMKAADPTRDYDVIKVDCSRQHHGIDCEGGIELFETKEELRERLDAERE